MSIRLHHKQLVTQSSVSDRSKLEAFTGPVHAVYLALSSLPSSTPAFRSHNNAAFIMIQGIFYARFFPQEGTLSPLIPNTTSHSPLLTSNPQVPRLSRSHRRDASPSPTTRRARRSSTLTSSRSTSSRARPFATATSPSTRPTASTQSSATPSSLRTLSICAMSSSSTLASSSRPTSTMPPTSASSAVSPLHFPRWRSKMNI